VTTLQVRIWWLAAVKADIFPPQGKGSTLLAFLFWNCFELSLSSFSLIAALSSVREKNCSLRRAAVIHVDTFRTDPSAWGLSRGWRIRAGIIAVL